MFCKYCGEAKRSDNLDKHCRGIHNDFERALESTDKPTHPSYKNWQAYMDNYPNVEAIPDDNCVTYLKQPMEDDEMESILVRKESEPLT